MSCLDIIGRTSREDGLKHKKSRSASPDLGCRPALLCSVSSVLLSVSSHAAGDAQCGSDGGQDGDQCLDYQFPDVFLFCVHVVFKFLSFKFLSS